MNEFTAHNHKKTKAAQRHAMTLIELLIVLALLGGLAAIALSGMGEYSARERVETTRQRLSVIHGAVMGDGVNPGRFLADMGRLPKVQETESGMILSELWKLPNNDLRYDAVVMVLRDLTATPPINLWPEAFTALPASVSLGCGWNGPYATITGKKLYDGFGNDFRLLLKQSDNSLDWEDVVGDSAKIGDEIYGVQSLGKDNAVDATGVTPEWYDADSARDFVNDYAAGFSLAPETTLTVIVKARDVMHNTWHEPVEVKVYSSSVTYDKNDYVTDSAGQYLFRCKNDGTVGQSLPSPTPPGDAHWDFIREITQEPHPWLTNVRIALFIPDISDTSKALAWVKSWDTSNFAATFTFTNLTPGIRKLYAYGAVALSGTSWKNAHGTGNEALTVELKPGANLITVYLTEKLN